MDILKEQQEFLASMIDVTLVTVEILKEHGFTLDKSDYTEYNEEIYHFDGIDIHKDTDSGCFMFATYVRANGYLKSGYNLTSLGRLKALFFGITGKELKKLPIPNKL